MGIPNRVELDSIVSILKYLAPIWDRPAKNTNVRFWDDFEVGGPEIWSLIDFRKFEAAHLSKPPLLLLNAFL